MAKVLSQDYHEQVKLQNIQKLRELEAKLPGFCTTFFRGISVRSGSRTCIAYAYDLIVFFTYVTNYILTDPDLPINKLGLDVLDKITRMDLENYIDYLSLYTSDDGVTHSNDEHGKARKLSAVRGLYNYFYEAELIKTNPASIVRSPKIHEKNIIRLDPGEVAKLLDIVEAGSDQESRHQGNYHRITRVRDVAMLTLLLGTGIRVSECVGLNMSDVDFDNCSIRVVRKGGNEAVVYFGNEVEDALRDYLEQRKEIIPLSGHEKALFLSMQNRRISVRAVENLVKKYASQVTTLKKITPHKLRSTYGTNLYKESGDIYLVASVLGHKDVNTTKRHYADMNEEAKRAARNMVKLRKE